MFSSRKIASATAASATAASATAASATAASATAGLAICAALSTGEVLVQGEEFHPRELDGLEMYLESVAGLAIATNDSREAYDATAENTPLESLWSDRRRFPHGTVRWWLDQSSYTNDKPIRPSRVFQTGRDIGQDDHDRPGYIPDGCNGKPCVRGGLIGEPEGEKHNKQPCYFELQLECRDFKIEGPFSLMLLMRPLAQDNDAVILGQYHRSVLVQNVARNCLEWKNLGQRIPISDPDSLTPERWHLVELHRDAGNHLQCVVSGQDVTAGDLVDEQPFVFMFLFNNNKGQGFAGMDPFVGDIAAFAVFRNELTEPEREKMRNYLVRTYGLGW